MENCDVKEIHPNQIKLIKLSQLDEETYKKMSVLLKMMSDPTRLRILHALFIHECCVCDLQEILDMSQSALSHQLNTLKLTRLVTSRRSGKNIFYSLNDEHVKLLFDLSHQHVLEQV
jgi:DNA-binding transcriptional ArsR family regulator